MTATAVEHRYRPRGSAVTVMESQAPELLVAGPAGTGKSRAMLEKLLVLALLHPGMRGLIVRKTAASLGTSALVTWREWVAAELLATGEIDWYGGSAEEPPQYRFRNGSRIMVGGMDKATRVMSTEYDVIYVQESIELTETDWEALSSRLRNGVVPFQQLMGDTNPDVETHWLNQRCKRGDCVMVDAAHTDNPRLYHPDGTLTEYGAEYIGRLDKLTGVRLQRLRHGLWVSAEGIIYDEWNPRLHLIDHRPIPEDWPRWWGVDFGYTNPTVVQWWAVDPDGRLILYREIYYTKRLVEDHARTIMAAVTDWWTCSQCGHRYPSKGGAEKCSECGSDKFEVPAADWTEPQPRGIICDHDAEDRATLERHLGMGTVAARKSVADGLQAVAERLRPEQDGLPRLAIMRDIVVERDPDLIEAAKPTTTAEEIPAYVWDQGAALRGKEQPLKVDDHGVDVMRYVVAEQDLKGRARVRFL